MASKKQLDLLRRLIEEARDEVQTIITKREDLADSRSDTWNDSEKGDEYREKTSEMEGFLSDLENALESLSFYES